MHRLNNSEYARRKPNDLCLKADLLI